MPKTIRLVKGQVPQQVHVLVATTPDIQRCSTWHRGSADGAPHILLYRTLAVPNLQLRSMSLTSTIHGACATRSAARGGLGLRLGSPRGLALPGYLGICGAPLLDRGRRLKGAGCASMVA